MFASDKLTSIYPNVLISELLEEAHTTVIAVIKTKFNRCYPSSKGKTQTLQTKYRI